MNVIFLGTPQFAVPSLLKLIESHHHVLSVVTQPDRPQGRHAEIVATPVKQVAIKHGICVHQFEQISKEGELILKGENPDIMITCAFGQILQQNILNIAPLGILNVHASLLPKYRGAAPIQSCIINGDRETGVSIMKTELSIDTGDVLKQEKIAILPDETAGQLTERLSIIGGQVLLESLKQLELGQATFVKQDHTRATYVKLIRKNDGKINWNCSSEQVHNLIRGVNPWPGAFTTYQNQTIKIWESRILPPSAVLSSTPGEIVCANPKTGLHIACKHGGIEVQSIQTVGGKRMSGAAFMRGRKMLLGGTMI